MLIGRGSELARIGQLLAEARLGTSGVLVIAGEPGVGKTALLRHAVEEARGMAVLQAKGVESEAELPFAGLYALLRPAFDRLDAPAPRQAAALKGALGLSPGVESDRFLIGAATLSLLASLAEHAPVLLVIDDAQWIDESVAERGPVRRPAPVRRRRWRCVIATRPGTAIELPTIDLRGLDPASAALVLERQAGGPLAPGTAERIYEATLGNPLALVELAGAPTPAELTLPADDGRARLREPHRQAARCRAPPARARGGRGPRRARRARPRGGAPRARAHRARARRARRPGDGRRRPARVLPPARPLGRLPLRLVG